MKPKTITNEQLISFIEQHLEDELSIKYIADYFGYSEFHFSRVFKSQMGTSLMEYACKRRMIKATEEIIRRQNIIDVAIKYGWQSHGGFSKAFKKEFGFSPSLLKAMIIELESLGGSAMEHIFLNQTDEHASKEQLEKILKDILIENNIEKDDTVLDNIIGCANNVYSGITRYSGDEYITHTLNVAIILAQLETDIITIEAGLFCDVIRKTNVSLDVLAEELPKDVQKIVEEISKFDLFKADQGASDSAILIKVAERLHNMRTIEFMDEKKRRIKAKETVDVFMPIARKIGSDKIIDELNNISIKYLL